MPEKGSRVCEDTVEYPALSTAATAISTEDACEADRLNNTTWKTFSNEIFGRSITWYGDSGATRDMTKPSSRYLRS